MRDNLYLTLEWLLAEARWCAEEWERARWSEDIGPQPFPWDAPDGEQASDG